MDQDTARRFGEFIRQLREKRRLSVRELASKSGIDSGGLTRLEHGRILAPRPDKLKALATALEVPLADMFAMAGYTVPYDLPSLAPYLRARYGHLPEETLSAVNDYLERLIDEHGLDPNGPLAFEDEQNGPSEPSER
ncbi:MAG: helix-turn-helix domain-containing protein [Acidobacteria bacterium]|nr:helix-turn-helix domain-containing protein [Acidobacteriota bacterium]